MNRRAIYLVLLSGVIVSLALYSSRAGGSRTDPPECKEVAKDEPNADAKKTVLANVRAYMEAFNRQDVKALLKLFDENCELIETDGTKVRGLKELEEELKDAFDADPKARISVEVDSLTFVTPDVAIEMGKTTYFPDGKTLTAEAEYQATHVKKGKTWLMTHARGFNRKVLSAYDRLRELEWLVGDWVDEGSDALVESTYRWNANKTFLLQDFTIRVKGDKVLSGTQRIGWDPLSKQIKSWVFDTEGGYGESVWSSVEDSWIVKAKAVRHDGKLVTVTNEITQVAKDRMRFESVDRIVGEERRPNFTAFAVRKAPAPKN
jgi:uncharacterized protein (TIGR02246 family)